MRSTKIVSIIAKKLFESGTAVLPGLGVLILREEGARIDFVENRIHPPGEKIDFLSARYLDDYALAYAMHRSEPISFETAVRRLREFIEKIERSTEAGEEFQLGELGYFSLVDGTLTFRQGTASWSNAHYGLPAVEAKPVNRFVEAKEQKRAAAATAAASSGGGGRQWLVGLMALVLIGFGLFMLLRILGLPEQQEAIIGPVFFQEERLNKRPAEVVPEWNPAPGSKHAEVDTTAKGAGIDTTAATGIHPNEKSGGDIDIAAGDGPEADLPVDEEDGDTGEWTEAEGTDESPDMAVEEAAPDMKADRQCIIIVGAFSVQRNVEKMVGRLKAGGYIPFTDQKGQLERVGLYAPCERGQLLDRLREVRREIEEGAWILNN